MGGEEGVGWRRERVEGVGTRVEKVGEMKLGGVEWRRGGEGGGGGKWSGGEGAVVDPGGVGDVAGRSPLTEVEGSGAKGGRMQVEGGPDRTLAYLKRLSESLVSSLHADCQVILGARASDEMVGRLRIVAVVSGL